jgi:uncharacterized membrane protein
MVARLWANLFRAWFQVSRWFPLETMHRLRDEIAAGERRHAGEVCLAIEARFSPWSVLRGLGTRERAHQVFSLLRVWDTRDNSGVLLYLHLAEHHVELVADRGIAERVDPALWRALCDDLAAGLRAGPPDAAVSRCLARINALLAEHFPASEDNPPELPDEPVVL